MATDPTASSPAVSGADAAVPDPVIPPLQPGDQLTRHEFHRRYCAMPPGTCAELVEGIVYMESDYMASPVRNLKQAKPHSHLMTCLVTYAAVTPVADTADNATIRLDRNNEVQPDCLMYLKPEHGGLVRLSDDDYIAGPPELVAEISSSTVSVDRGPKLRSYLQNGVPEVLTWRVEDRLIEWNSLCGDDYQLIKPREDGVLCSNIFPGLWLDATALIAGDLARVLAVLAEGTASEAHLDYLKSRTD